MAGIHRISEDRAARDAGMPTLAQSHVARRELLHQISNFLLDFELEVTPNNLAVALAVVSGANPGLSRQIVVRQHANQPVTQAWLDDVLGQAEQDRKRRAAAAERETLTPLVQKLQDSLQQFAQSAGQAGATATEYHAALFETATTLEAARPIVELPTLTQLTGAMLERTGLVQEQMKLYAGEAAGLRESLQLAHADVEIEQSLVIGDPRSFDAVLDREYRAAREAGEPLSVAFCSIDGFQALNDSHGRDTGDRLIQALGRGLRRIAASGCHVIPHGGEHFALLFRGISPDQARQKLDEARQEFAQRKLVDRKTEVPIGTVTFSGGLADVFAYADPRAAMQAADDALGRAREQGCNLILFPVHQPVGAFSPG